MMIADTSFSVARIVVDWEAVAAIAGSIYTAAFVISVFVLRQQLRAIRLANYSQAYVAAAESLRDPSLMKGRDMVLRSANQPAATRFHGNVTPIGGEGYVSKRDLAEMVCRSYNDLAVMITRAMLPADAANPAWISETKKLWPILRDFAVEERQRLSDPQLWLDFENLATT